MITYNYSNVLLLFAVHCWRTQGKCTSATMPDCNSRTFVAKACPKKRPERNSPCKSFGFLSQLHCKQSISLFVVCAFSSSNLDGWWTSESLIMQDYSELQASMWANDESVRKVLHVAKVFHHNHHKTLTYY